MDLNLKIAGYDITQLVDQYREKTIEELFPNFNIISNEMGEFMELIWDEVDANSYFDLSITRKKLVRNLKTVFNVGENVEKHLQKRGIKTLSDLKFNLRFGQSANELLQLIKEKNFAELSKNKYIYDLDLGFCFKLEELLFLDIETLGIYDSPMIIVGVGFYKNAKFEIHLFFARDIGEEIAICEHLRKKILPEFRCFVSYNGKSFDIPYLASRFLYFFDENPLIRQKDTPYKDVNTKFHHIDLYHQCRRKFKGQFYNYTLTTMEQRLLHWERENELPSSLVGMCYRKYLKNPKRYIGLVKECIEHNYYDVFSLPLILKKLL